MILVLRHFANGNSVPTETTKIKQNLAVFWLRNKTESKNKKYQ